jgi:HEAT repeat protein
MTWVVVGAVAALVGCSEAVILAGLDVALLRSLRRRKRERAIAAVAPQIHALLVDFLSGADKVEELRRFLDRDSAALSEGILLFRGAVAGGAKERLCELTLELGLVRDWCAEARSSSVVNRRAAFARLAFVTSYEPCRRLAGELQAAAIEDPDDDTRISAARGLIQAGAAAMLDSVFEFALSSDPLTRAVLAEDLRIHASELAEQAIPAALSSTDSSIVLSTLEVLSAWQRAVLIPDLPRLLEHPDTAVKLHALGLAPLMPLTPQARSAIVRALDDPDPEVSAAATLGAGRLGLQESLPYLAALAREADAEVARSVTAALAAMPPRGWKALEELSAGLNTVTAHIARAALAGVRGEPRA